jgi:hypothetical protein
MMIDDAYAEALGRAVFAFAVLEWNAIWCCEEMDSGYMGRPGHRGKIRTSAEHANNLVRLVKDYVNPKIPAEWLAAAEQFKRLVELRNSIFHGQPGSTPAEEQRLFRKGFAWTPRKVHNVAARFAACSNLLRSLYEYLKNPPLAAAS